MFFTVLSLSCISAFALLSRSFLHSIIYCILLARKLQSHFSLYRVSQSAGQVMNPHPHPSACGAQRALSSHSSAGARQSGMQIGRCRSKFVWRDHHKGSSSVDNVGWHVAQFSMMVAWSKRLYTYIYIYSRVFSERVHAMGGKRNQDSLIL